MCTAPGIDPWGTGSSTFSRKCVAIALAVGCSNRSVEESVDTPVCTRKRDASSVAESESMPASISGVSALMSSGLGAADSSRTTSNTTPSTRTRCCAGENLARSATSPSLLRAVDAPAA